MTQQPRSPGRSEAGQAARAKREARLAEALRDTRPTAKPQSPARARDRARDQAAGGNPAAAATSPRTTP